MGGRTFLTAGANCPAGCSGPSCFQLSGAGAEPLIRVPRQHPHVALSGQRPCFPMPADPRVEGWRRRWRVRSKMGDIMWRYYVSLVGCAWVLVTCSVAHAEGLTRESLKAAYSDIRMLSAEIEQTKSSPYLYKPLVSMVHMEYAGGRVLWRILKPVRGEMVFDNGSISIEATAALPPGAADRMAPLMRCFRAIFSVDFAAIEKDFDLLISENSLEAASRPGSDVSFVKRLVFRFGPDLSLAQVTVEAEDETTELTFLHFEISPAGTPKPTP